MDDRLEEPIEFVYRAEGAGGRSRSVRRRHPFEGIIPSFERRFRETDSVAVRRDLLVLMGCDELQGFLFARPMSARAFGLWALDERPQGKSQFRASLFAETDTHAPG